MSRSRVLVIALLAIGVVAVPALAFGVLRPILSSRQIWTPAPATAPGVTPANETPLPTVTSQPATEIPPTEPPPTPAPTKSEARAAPTASATATRPPATTTPTMPAPTVAPTASGPQTVVVTEADIAAAIQSGIAAQNGLATDGLQIHFTGGRVHITATRVSYGFVQVDNLVMVGRLVAQDGALQMETESISPSGLVTAMIPGLVNQALRQYGSQWYVEDVHTSEGQIELTVR